MPTTTNYGWTTPADTDLVKDGASAIRTLGTAIDTTTKNLNPSTTLGDMEYRSSTTNVNTRLPLGTANQQLRVNSGATAPEWFTPAAAGGITLISTTALTSGSAVTLSSIPQTYKSLYITVTSWRASSQAQIQLTFNGAASANDYAELTTTGAGGFTESAITLTPNQPNNATNTFLRANLLNYADSTSWKTVEYTAVNDDVITAGNARVKMGYVGIKKGTTAITSLVFTISAGTFAAGTLNLYGVS